MSAKDERTEQYLTRMGVKWEYVNDLTYDKLVPLWDGVNLGRSRVKVEEATIEYGIREQAGSIPPAPILRDTHEGLEVLDGVQRLMAKQLIDCTRFSAYVVTTGSDLLARQIRVMANHVLNGGHGESAQWTRRQAVQMLVIDGGMSCEEVARLGGWNVKDMEEDRTYLETDFTIRSVGGPEGLSKGVVLNVAKYATKCDMKKAAKPVAEFFQDLKRGRFTNGDSDPYIKAFFDVRRSKEVYQQLTDNLASFRRDPEVVTRLEGRKPSKRLPDGRLRWALKSALSVSSELVAAEEEIRYIDEFFHLLNQIRTNLQTLQRGATATTK